MFGSAALSDRLRAKLFSATVETVLLYNAVTWTLTDTLKQELDAAHSHLLRAALNVRWPERVRNSVLYARAGLQPPSARLREERLRLVGELIRTEEVRPQPVQRLLLWRPTQRQRRGQSRRRLFPDIIFEDYEAPDQVSAVQHVRRCAMNARI